MQNQYSSQTYLYQAAHLMVKADPSLTVEEAANRIRKYTGFPASEEAGTRDNEHTRLGWDEYFMSVAFLIAMRSPDAQTQHGSVIVNNQNQLVSTGYNGFLQGAIDHDMPNIRPKKYLHILHSEFNAVTSANQNLKGCKAYVTGPPCNECLKLMAKSGIKLIIVGDRPHVFSEGYLEQQSLICAMHQISIRNFVGKIAHLDGREIKNENHTKSQ